MIKDFEPVLGAGFPSVVEISSASGAFPDMGARTINLQCRFDGQTTPDFTKAWEFIYKGNKYIMPLRKPQGAKENTSLSGTLELPFQHWAEYQLQRHFFFELYSVQAGTVIPDKYIASVELNLENFCILFARVLEYWYGDKITLDIDQATIQNATSDVQKVEISYSYMWDVLLKFHEIYGVRWQIEPNGDADHYVIKIRYGSPVELSHIFEYGFKGGLLKVERQVQNPDIRNKILGRGGEKNLPYRYFKDVDPNNPTFKADPDWIPELALMPFTQLHGATFRSYIRGWKAKHYGGTATKDDCYAPWAWEKGYTDAKFDPVEFVYDAESIAFYGELWGALDDNDEIYPSIQGRVRAGIGRIDEVVAVEPIVSDDYAAKSEKESQPVNVGLCSPNSVFVKKESTETVTLVGGSFTIPEGLTGDFIHNAATAIAYDNPQYRGGASATSARQEGRVAEYDKFLSATVKKVNIQGATSASGIPAGTYTWSVEIEVKNTSNKDLTATVALPNSKVEASNADEQFTNTWCVWIKDVFNTPKPANKSAEAFAAEVWGPLLGDHLGNEAALFFTSGMLSTSEDYTFLLTKRPEYDPSKSIEVDGVGTVQSMWKLTLAKSDADLEATNLWLPSTMRQASAGDHFAFEGIELPHQYVLMAEEEIDNAKKQELEKIKDIKPTWVVSLDKVRISRAQFDDVTALIDQLVPGAAVRLHDPRFILNAQGTPAAYETLYITNVNIEWREPSSDSPALIPDLEITLSDKYEVAASTIQRMQSEIDALIRQVGSLGNLEQLFRSVGDKLYLRKDGLADISMSPTQFFSLLTSGDFRNGMVGGAGWGFFRDANGNWVLETDRINVRQEMLVNSLVINQVKGQGGTIVEGAAVIEAVTEVIEDNTGYYCYFDTKNGTVFNQFRVDDVAYCHRYVPTTAADNTTETFGTVKFYKRRVIEVGDNYIKLSKTDVNGSGIPAEGDAIIHYGNYTDLQRQYVKVRDVIGGGYERYLEDLNSVTAAGTEYYFVGRQAGMYGDKPRWFIGNRDKVPGSGKGDGSFIEYKDRQFNLNNVRLSLTSTVGDTNIGDYVNNAAQSAANAAKAELQGKINDLQNQVDGVVEAWSYPYTPTTSNYPADQWTTEGEKNAHVGDVFYNIQPAYNADGTANPDAGKAWRWSQGDDEHGGAYHWHPIADSDAVRALQLAQMSVLDTDVLFKQHISQTDAPALPTVNTEGTITNPNGWSTNAPAYEAGKYIWQITYVKKGDGQASFSDPTCISGRDGASVNISSQSVRYSTDHGSTQPADSTFTLTTVPTLSAGQYLWSRTEVTYNNGQSTKSYAVSRVGTDGANYSPNLLKNTLRDVTSSNYGITSYALDKEVTKGKQYTITIWGELGADRSAFYLTTKGGGQGQVTLKKIADGVYSATWNWVGDSGHVTIYQLPSSGTSSSTINKIKLEEGKNSDPQWSPAASEMIGTQGYSIVASVPRPNFTEAQWNTYGTTGHVENWTNTESIRNGCRIGDYFKIYGTATDTGNSHVLVYKSDTASGTLHGECVSHEIAEAGESISITSTSVTYAKTSNSTQPADSAFTYNSIGAANPALGDYLWTKTIVNYSDGSSTKSYSVSRLGADGDDGIPGAPGADGKTTYVHFAYASGITGNLPHPTAVIGFSTTAFDGAKYIGICTDYNQADPTTNVAQTYEWSEYKGEDGNGIDRIEEEYYLSTSRTQTLGGSWSTTRQPWVAGHFYWTRSHVYYTDGTDETYGEVCVTGESGANAPNLVIKYSATGGTAESEWHPTFVAGDVWMKTSNDGGTTWSPAMPFVGSSYAANIFPSKYFNLTDAGARLTKAGSLGSPLIAGGHNYRFYFIDAYKPIKQAGYFSVSMWVKSTSGSITLKVDINDNDIIPATTIGTTWVRLTGTVKVTQYINVYGFFDIDVTSGTAANLRFSDVVVTPTEAPLESWVPTADEMVGQDGKWRKFQWAKNNSTTSAADIAESSWKDTPLTASAGEYVWMRSGIVVPPATNPTTWETATRLTGDKGGDGYMLDLSDEMMPMPCDAAGNVVGAYNTSQASVYKGATKLTSGITYSIAQQTGVSATITSAGLVTPSALTADRGTIVVQAVVDGLTLQTTLSLYKVKPGSNYSNNLVVGSKLFQTPSVATGIIGTVNSSGELNVDCQSGNGNWFTNFWKSLNSTEIEDSFAEGDDFTISFTIKSSTANANTPTVYLKAGMGYYAMKGTISSEYSVIYYSGKWKKANGFKPHLGWGNCSGSYTIKSWKIEKGANSNPVWSPAASEMVGEDGKPAVVYQLELSANNISRNALGQLSTSEITIQKYKTTGASARVLTTEKIIRYQRLGVDSGYTQVNAGVNQTKVSNLNNPAMTALLVELYDTDGTTILDRERIPLIQDGAELTENLVLNSEINKTSSAYLLGTFTTSEDLVAGDTYTFTIWGSVATGKQFGIWDSRGSQRNANLTKIAEGIYSATLQWAKSSTAAANQFNVYNYPQNTSGSATITRIKVEKGQNLAPVWTQSPHDMDYLKKAMQENGSMEGGLILASLMQMGFTDSSGVYKKMSGVSGFAANSDDLAFWAGGEMIDPAKQPNASNLPAFGIRQDGTGFAAGNTIRFLQNLIEVGKYLKLNQDGMKMVVDGKEKLAIGNMTVDGSDVLTQETRITFAATGNISLSFNKGDIKVKNNSLATAFGFYFNPDKFWKSSYIREVKQGVTAGTTFYLSGQMMMNTIVSPIFQTIDVDNAPWLLVEIKYYNNTLHTFEIPPTLNGVQMVWGFGSVFFKAAATYSVLSIYFRLVQHTNESVDQGSWSSAPAGNVNWTGNSTPIIAHEMIAVEDREDVTILGSNGLQMSWGDTHQYQQNGLWGVRCLGNGIRVTPQGIFVMTGGNDPRLLKQYIIDVVKEAFNVTEK
ncbi:MAG: hypothetical protein K2K82_08660 [Muribaculaceae bacterium]|nr:hypothetical protein [Muribaculaceae bacterium]